ncbi:histidine kinase [Petroclostridium sp. X23]|uniref:sensor histidine kinase n=1 Tax=Petroclostridium sp. X23 TaxID=3045146 RepID=UPI0024AE1A91|nr:histidine kinase [Petroclostridium sp. X23]WHH57144.1 histidine kinase [Petroclostridium sp. X23]
MILNRYIPIQVKLLTTYLMIFIIPLLLIATITYSVFSNAMEKAAVDKALTINEQMLNRLDSYLYDIEKAASRLSANNQIVELMREGGYYFSESQKFKDTLLLYQNLKNIVNLKDDIQGILLVAENNSIYHWSEHQMDVGDDIIYDDWVKMMSDYHISKLILGQDHKNYFRDKNKKVFSTIFKIYYSPNGGSKTSILGIVRVDSGIKVLQDLYSKELFNYQKEFKTSILDGNLNVIFDTNEESIGRKLDGEIARKLNTVVNGSFYLKGSGQGEFYIVNTSTYTGCKILTSIPLSVLLKDVNYIRKLTLIISILFLILAIAVSTLISYTITKPIKVLKERMKNVEKGNMQTWGQTVATDEIGDLTNSFNNMVYKLDNTIKNEYALKLKEKEAQLNALQSQITPHFLYNTLETVSCIAFNKNVQEICVIAKSLGKMFRYSIKGGRISTVKSEIEHVKAYLEIQKIRMPNRFDTLIKVDGELWEHIIIKLVLQPLVENAVMHGLSGKQEDGYVAVLVGKNVDKIEIKIIDNGVGLEQAEVDALNQSLLGENRSFMKYSNDKYSIGIQNVNARIKLFYGERYGLRYESMKGVGTTVYVSLPIIQTGDEDDSKSFDC